jgi:hypothetical protein
MLYFASALVNTLQFSSLEFLLDMPGKRVTRLPARGLPDSVVPSEIASKGKLDASDAASSSEQLKMSPPSASCNPTHPSSNPWQPCGPPVHAWTDYMRMSLPLWA